MAKICGLPLCSYWNLLPQSGKNGNSAADAGAAVTIKNIPAMMERVVVNNTTNTVVITNPSVLSQTFTPPPQALQLRGQPPAAPKSSPSSGGIAGAGAAGTGATALLARSLPPSVAPKAIPVQNTAPPNKTPPGQWQPSGPPANGKPPSQVSRRLLIRLHRRLRAQRRSRLPAAPKQDSHCQTLADHRRRHRAARGPSQVSYRLSLRLHRRRLLARHQKQLLPKPKVVSHRQVPVDRCKWQAAGVASRLRAARSNVTALVQHCRACR